MMICPICHSHAVGKVGYCEFFCGECMSQFKMEQDQIEVYRINDMGKYSLMGSVKSLL